MASLDELAQPLRDAGGKPDAYTLPASTVDLVREALDHVTRMDQRRVGEWHDYIGAMDRARRALRELNTMLAMSRSLEP